jgi:hypothetical protein
VNRKKQFSVGFPTWTGRSSFLLGFKSEPEEAVFCWVSNVNQIVTQLRFIHNWFITGIQSMLLHRWVQFFSVRSSAWWWQEPGVRFLSHVQRDLWDNEHL